MKGQNVKGQDVKVEENDPEENTTEDPLEKQRVSRIFVSFEKYSSYLCYGSVFDIY